VDDAAAMQARLADARFWERIFPWSDTLIKVGYLPAPHSVGTAIRGGTLTLILAMLLEQH